MKGWWLTVMLMLTGLAARAELVRPIDPNRMADVNGQSANTRQVTLPTVSLSEYQPRPLPRELRRVPTHTCDTKTLAVPQYDRTRQLRYPTSPVAQAPTRNFTHRSANLPGQRPVAQAPVPTQRPPVSERVIEATTPKGEAELVEQLRWFPKRVQ